MPPRRIQNSTSSTAEVSESALVAEATAFFVSSIHDPWNPRHCGKCLDGALHESTLSEQKDLAISRTYKPKNELKYNPVLWDPIAAFLFLKRTDQQIKKLMTRLSECKCGTNSSLVRRNQAQESIWRYHDIGETTVNPAMARTSMDRDGAFKDDEFNPTKTFDAYSCAFIVNLFTILTVPLGQSSTKSAAKGLSRFWPIHLKDLIPFGPDDFVQSMLQWYQFVPDSIIFNLTALVLRACKLLVVPSLVKFNFFKTAVDSTRSMIDRAMADLDTSKYPLPHTPTQKHAIIHTILRTMNRVRFHSQDWITYLSICMQDVSFAYSVALVRGQETKAMQICSMLIYLRTELEKNSSPEEVQHLAQQGQSLFRSFYMQNPQWPAMPVHPRVHQLDSKAFPVRFTATNSDCRECQLQAWKEGDYPHKRVCPVLRRLVNQGGGPDLFFSGNKPDLPSKTRVTGVADVSAIMQRWKMTTIDNQDLKLVADWGKSIQFSKEYPRPDDTTWTPGYDDYDEIIAKLSLKGLPPMYLDRVAREE